MRIEDTPSIVGNQIAVVRDGRSVTVRYENLTGHEKRDYLFDQGILATAYSAQSLPDIITGQIRFAGAALVTGARQSLGRTLTRVSDEFETPQAKLFHTFGTTAKIVFTPAPGTPFTGLFSRPAHGLARFSYAGPVGRSLTPGVGIVPGLGLKFPIDGNRASENLVVMRMLDRQTDASVFQHPFTNILPDPGLFNLVMQGVKVSFERVVTVGEGLHQALDNLAAICTDGSPVDNARAPHRIIFRPTQTAQSLSGKGEEFDFRIDLDRNIASGTPIYDVLALDEPQEQGLNGKDVEDLVEHGRQVGVITTESSFVASSYGDYRLFFQA